MAAAGPASEWLQQDSRRMLHAVYRVGDMQVTGVELQPLPPTALHQAELMA
jgi:hypothetical protein